MGLRAIVNFARIQGNDVTDLKREYGAMSLNKALLDILVCPQCKGELQLEADESGLRCDACRLRYAIRDDIPIMLVDEAQPLDA
jgi:uncharacterized protein